MDERATTERSPEEVRERIEATRARMSETIEEIGAHLDPEHLKHEFKAGMREQVEETKSALRGATIGRAETMMHDMEETMNQTGRTLMDTIRDNPVPAAMVGIGLGWLFAEGRRQQPRQGRRDREWYGTAAAVPRDWDLAEPGYPGPTYTEPVYAEPVVGMEVDVVEVEVEGGATEPGATERVRRKAAETGERMSARAGDTADRARETASRVADQARHTAERAQQTASQAADAARSRAGQVRRGAQQTWHEAEMQARRVESRLERSMRESPLAAGAAMAAVGFAAGMMLPETEREREMMGPARERVAERAQQTAREAGEKVRHVAEETARQAQTAAKEAARREGMSA